MSSSSHRGCLKLSVVGGFRLGRRDVADRLEETTVVEPVDPFEGGELDSLEAAPWASAVDDLGLEQAVDRFGESVVVAVADTADRWFDAGLGKAFSVFDRDVLDPTDAVLFVKWRSAPDNLGPEL